MAKYWLTDVQCQVIDRGLQLHGGYGFMSEYPIARLYADSRASRIYGGANEVMKDLIARPPLTTPHRVALGDPSGPRPVLSEPAGSTR